MTHIQHRHVQDKHYVVTVKVEKVVSGTNELAEVYKDSGRSTGIKKQEPFRDVSTVANFNVSDRDLNRLLDKVKGHLDLVDDSQISVHVDSNVPTGRPIRDNPQA